MGMIHLRRVCRLAYTLWGDADYVQPGLLSHSERARLDGMHVHHVLAEVAATSTTHRDAAAKRAGGEYWGVSRVQGNKWSMRFIRSGAEHVLVHHASAEKAARAWDDLAWKRDRWCAAAMCRFCGA